MIIPLLVITAGDRLLGVIAAGVAIYLLLCAGVAVYGRDRGFPFLPLFISAVFLGFPLVLLAVTIAAGRRDPPG